MGDSSAPQIADSSGTLNGSDLSLILLTPPLLLLLLKTFYEKILDRTFIWKLVNNNQRLLKALQIIYL